MASIDFGTACSGWAYSLTEDVLADPDKITVKRWISGSITSYKTRTSVLLSPDGSSVKAFGCDAEKKYAMLVKDGRNKNYYLFSRFKVELHKLINKVTFYHMASRMGVIKRHISKSINHYKNK